MESKSAAGLTYVGGFLMWLIWVTAVQMLALDVAANDGLFRYGQLMASFLAAAALSAPLATLLPKLPVVPLWGIAGCSTALLFVYDHFWVNALSVGLSTTVFWLMYLRMKGELYGTVLQSPKRRGWFVAITDIAMTAGVALGTATFLLYETWFFAVAVLCPAMFVAVWMFHHGGVAPKTSLRVRTRSLSIGVRMALPALGAIVVVASLAEMVTGWTATFHTPTVTAVVGFAVFAGALISPMCAHLLRKFRAAYRPFVVLTCSFSLLPFVSFPFAAVVLAVLVVGLSNGIYLIAESDTADAAILVGAPAPALAGVVSSWYLLVAVAATPLAWMLEQPWWIPGVIVSGLLFAAAYAAWVQFYGMSEDKESVTDSGSETSMQSP